MHLKSGIHENGGSSACHRQWGATVKGCAVLQIPRTAHGRFVTIFQSTAAASRSHCSDCSAWFRTFSAKWKERRNHWAQRKCRDRFFENGTLYLQIKAVIFYLVQTPCCLRSALRSSGWVREEIAIGVTESCAEGRKDLPPASRSLGVALVCDRLLFPFECAQISIGFGITKPAHRSTPGDDARESTRKWRAAA